MKLFGVLTILFALCCVAATILSIFLKPKYLLATRIGLGVSYALFFLFLLLWGNKMYEGGNIALALSTFAVGGLTFGTLLLAPIFRKNKIGTWIVMTCFLLLAIAFIFLAVYLSKTVIQPNAPLG